MGPQWTTRARQMRAGLLKAAVKWDCQVIDMWGNLEANETLRGDYNRYYIDGTGNRVAATLYGRKKVYFIIGVNKIAPDFESALWRARNIASPKNAQRIGVRTPCAVKGDKCYDCSSPDRGCRALVVLWEKPRNVEVMEVLLIDQELGY